MALDFIWAEGSSGTQDVRYYEEIKRHFATLNIGAYHSKDVKSYASLLALPSSRVSLSWAQNHLFPEADAGRRIVICMRAAAFWGANPVLVTDKGWQLRFRTDSTDNRSQTFSRVSYSVCKD